MRLPPCFLAVVTVIILANSPATSQFSLSTLTVRGGILRTIQTEGHRWTFYPEIQVGGRLITPWLDWGLSWGYWNDGVESVFPVADYVTYHQAGHIIIFRAGFLPQQALAHWPLPIKLFGGVAEHLQTSTYVGGSDMNGNGGVNSSTRATTLYAGVSFALPLWTALSLEAEAAQFIPVGWGESNTGQKERRDFKIGMMLTL